MKHETVLLMLGSLMFAAAQAQTVGESSLGEAVERQLPGDQPFTEAVRDPWLLKTEAGDTFESRQLAGEKLETVKLTGVIPPIQFESGVANIPQEYVDLLRTALESVREHRNVRLHLVGHADDQRLSEALARTYGDNAGLSRERAGEVAEFLQRALLLSPEAVSYEWAGDTRPIASNATAAGRALNRRVEVEVWYDQPTAKPIEEEVLVQANFKQVKVCRVETLCRMRFRDGHSRRARVKNLVPPLHYSDEATDVPADFIEHIRKALDNLRDKQNVVVKLIGYTDNVALTDRNERIYGDAIVLSKARAHRAALAVKDALGLSSAAVASDGRGASAPLASNDTAQGRALNRRIEVQFWHDDPLQELPDEPQLCPDDGDAEKVTKVYDPPWGSIPPLQLEGGQAVIPPGYIESLHRALADISDRTSARLRFVGYTGNERLDRRTAVVYGDDIGLSAARARRAMEAVRERMQLSPSQAEHEGRGYVQSDDVVNAGFTQGEASYVVVQVVYDELAIADDYEGVDITRVTRELRPKSAYGLNLMHITVDGQPLDDPDRSSADVQRCTDVALAKADIQFQFDNLKSRPRLAVAAAPDVLEVRPLAGEGLSAPPVYFKMYTNYSYFIRSAEVRVFDTGQSVQSEPLAIVRIDPNGYAEWQPDARHLSGARRELKYVLRAYGESGNFDDTSAQSLWIMHDGRAAPEQERGAHEHSGAVVTLYDNAEPLDLSAAIGTTTQFETELEPVASAEYAYGSSLDSRKTGTATYFGTEAEPFPVPHDATARPERELLSRYGESGLAIRNIRLSSGTVTVRGSGIPEQHTVWVAGRPVPVDPNGNFIAEEILPSGTHTIEVAVLDPELNGTLFLRDLEFQLNDRFYVGMADLTFAQNRTRGPAQLLQGANAPYDFGSSLDGRLAFYATEKFGDHWRVSASADTREGPVKDLFSNFLNKSPDSLFRRIDADYHYPTFGDDSIVEEIAPTLGKFFLKVNHGENHALWGNFKTGYLENELAQVDRGLYGANGHWQSGATTSFGERRASLDVFAAEPGTVASRDEFRGTGGSLYFLRNQDILTGSERARIELRDKDSGLVTGSIDLRPALDYDIDYLQGRVLLSEPLSATANDNLLVRTGGLSGEETYLVVRYEYTPGFDELDGLTTGGQGHVWFNDYIKLGITGNTSDEGGSASGVRGADLTLRKSVDSWLKVQTATSEGLVSNSLYSDDGGFGFVGNDPLSFEDANASGYRADLSVGVADFFSAGKGRLTLYTQSLDGGYSAPGFASLTDVQHYGGTFNLPLGRLEVTAKADRKVQELGLQTTAQELDVGYHLTEKWTLSTGVRKDLRQDDSPTVPLTQENGERTDAVVQMAFDSLSSWRAYAFVQDTLSKTDGRDDNGRAGLGGSYRFGKRLRFDAEVSDGDVGMGGRVGTQYLHSDRTNLYLNYALDNERAESGLQGRRGNLISGVKRRLSDSSSVYVEERYQDGDLMSGLTHATGVNLSARDRWNFGANAEMGTLTDSLTGAQTERTAGGIRMGYALERVQLSSGIEYRFDQMEQPDTSIAERTTWLFRNNFKYQVTPDWRLVGKLNRSFSDSSQGQFYDGGYTEAVIGYGYRPVLNDRLNALAKYTYFHNVPTMGQVTLQDTAAQFIQKSHIASLDLQYDLTQSFSLGAKYAYRIGQISLERTDSQFFDNEAQLYVVRADWQFRHRWEGLIEARMLEMPDFNERRGGALLGIYRYLGKHVKAGVGYNFTDFSEDLTDLSFRHQGVFMNVIGAM